LPFHLLPRYGRFKCIKIFLDLDSSATGIRFLAPRFINPCCPYFPAILNTFDTIHPPRAMAKGVQIYKLIPQAYKTPNPAIVPTTDATSQPIYCPFRPRNSMGRLIPRLMIKIFAAISVSCLQAKK
jgi:hypothetical protein